MPACLDELRREFSHEFRHLHHDKPWQFATSQWQRTTAHTWLFVVYRWLLAAFLLVSSILTMFLDRSGVRWPIYLTNWGFSLLTAQALLAAGLATRHLLGDSCESMSVLHKSYWVLNNLANVFSLFNTLAFWIFVHNPEIPYHSLTDFSNVVTHVLNSCIVLVDLLVAGHPVRLFHAYHSLALLLVYYIFTGVYFLAGGTNLRGQLAIYAGVLDWQTPHTTFAYLVLSAAGFLLLHGFLWLLHLLRRSIAKICSCGYSDEPSVDTITYMASGMV